MFVLDNYGDDAWITGDDGETLQFVPRFAPKDPADIQSDWIFSGDIIQEDIIDQ